MSIRTTCFLVVLLAVSAASTNEHEATLEHGHMLSAWFEKAKREAHDTISKRLAQPEREDEPEHGAVGRRLSGSKFDPATVLGQFKCVITAFAPEISQLVKGMSGKIVNVTRAGRKFILGTVDGKPVVATICGQGMTNAAMTAALMAELFPIKRMFFSGIAGAVNPKVHVGDVVIPTKWAQYQYVKYVKKAPAGQAGFTDYAIDFPNKFYTINNKVPSALYPTAAPPANIAKDGVVQTAKTGSFLRLSKFSVPAYVDTLVKADDAFVNTPQQFWFPVDAKLLAAAKKAIAKGIHLISRGFDPITSANFSLPYAVKVTIGAAGVSGTTFVDNVEFREQVFQTHNAQVVDMESAGFMHACRSAGVPCLVVRSASDLAGGQQGLNVVLTFLGIAASNSVKVLRVILAAL